MSGFSLGDKILITTDLWFIAPNGVSYRAVYGTVHGVVDSESALGIKTNSKSTNWYIKIGNMMIAGCQIHYAIKSEKCNFGSSAHYSVTDGVVKEYQIPSHIFNADESI